MIKGAVPEDGDDIVDRWIDKAVMTIVAAAFVGAAAQFSSPATIEIHQDPLVGPVTMTGFNVAVLQPPVPHPLLVDLHQW